MPDDLRTTLRTLAKTALLCALLGLMLYGAMMLMAQMPNAGQLLGVALAAPSAVLIAHLVLGALRDGQFPVRGPALLRDSQPIQYWFSIAWFAGCAVALAAIALWCAWVVLAGAG